MRSPALLSPVLPPGAMQAQTRLLALVSPLTPLIGLPERGPRHPASTSYRTAYVVQARGGRGEQGRLQQSVQQAPQPAVSWLAGTPWYVSVPAALLAAGLALQLVKRLRGQQGCADGAVQLMLSLLLPEH